MKIITEKITVDMAAENGMEDITGIIQGLLNNAGLINGVVTIFTVGSTGGISTIEYEPGLTKDIPQILEKIAPMEKNYHHHKTWGCDNGGSHVRSTLIGSSLSVPFHNKKLTLGTWQQIIVMNFDTKSRARDVVIQLMGE